MEQTNDFERIEVCGMGGMQVYRGTIALQIKSENVVIEIGIVSQQHAIAHILHKILQGLGCGQTGIALQFGNNGVTQSYRYILRLERIVAGTLTQQNPRKGDAWETVLNIGRTLHLTFMVIDRLLASNQT